MIPMVVRDDHIVENHYIRQLQHTRDAVGIARDLWRLGRGRSAWRGGHALISGEARVHQHRFSIRRHKERGLSAFGIEEIDIQGFLRGRPGLWRLCQKGDLYEHRYRRRENLSHRSSSVKLKLPISASAPARRG